MDIEDRRKELLELRERDPKKLLQVWRDAGGVPPGIETKEDVDYENVIIPAILQAEFPQ